MGSDFAELLNNIDGADRLLAVLDSMEEDEKSDFLSYLFSRSYEDFLARGESEGEASESSLRKNTEYAEHLAEAIINADTSTTQIIPHKAYSHIFSDPTLSESIFNQGSRELVHDTEQIRSIITIDYNEENLSSLLSSVSISLSAYDRIVYDAICSLYVAGNRVMSLEMIYRAITYTENPGAAAETTLNRIRESVIKLTTSTVRISGELKGGDGEVRELYQTLLFASFTKGHFRTGQDVEECLVLSAPPILYQYAKKFGVVHQVPSKLLQGSYSSTTASVLCRNFILSKIQMCLICQQSSLTIGMEDVYKPFLTEGASQNTQKMAKKRARKYLESTMEDWIASGIIYSYEWLKENPSRPTMVTGVVLHPISDVFELVSERLLESK